MLYKWTKNQLYSFCTKLQDQGYERKDDDTTGEYIFSNGQKQVSILPTEAGYDIITE
jgi:hypothetical protein